MSATTRIKPINVSDETACPAGYSGLIGTVDCKGAIHCADGVKSFGPIPCLSGPQGDLLFDIDSQKCVIPSNDFNCQQLPNEENNREEEVEILQSESKELGENKNAAEEPQADQPHDSQTQTESPTNIQIPPPTTPGEIEVTERISFPEVAEDDASDDMENNVLGPLSLKELIIISAGGGCLVLFIGMSVFFAARRKRSAEEKKSQNNQDEKQHNAGKLSSSTIDARGDNGAASSSPPVLGTTDDVPAMEPSPPRCSMLTQHNDNAMECWQYGAVDSDGSVLVLECILPCGLASTKNKKRGTRCVDLRQIN